MNDSFHTSAPAVHRLKEAFHSHHRVSWSRVACEADTCSGTTNPRINPGQLGRRDESSLVSKVNVEICRSFLFVATQGLINTECVP